MTWQRQNEVVRARGPWRILPDCPAEQHNTRRMAARGPVEGRCVCPHGQELRQEELAVKRQRDRSRSGTRIRSRAKPEAERVSVPQYMSNLAEDLHQMPDLSKGRCVTRKSGITVMARTFATEGGARPGRIQFAAAKAMCEQCPLRLPCGAWALKTEVPAGSWGGVYGGMTWRERQIEAAKLTTEEGA